MSRPATTSAAPDPIELDIERALWPGAYVDYSGGSAFVSGLESCAQAIDAVAITGPARAAELFETLLAGCHAKADEVDDSDGEMGHFAGTVYLRCIKAKDAAGADPANTARWVLERTEKDDYGFAHDLLQKAPGAMSVETLAAFESLAREQFDEARRSPEERERSYGLRRWGEALRAVHLARGDAAAYEAFCRVTGLTVEDCLALAGILRPAKPKVALRWVTRGQKLNAKSQFPSGRDHDLRRLKRELLLQLGRGGEAVLDAWKQFRASPHAFYLQDAMKLVPEAERDAWRAKAIRIAARVDLGRAIGIFTELATVEQLATRIARGTDAELEGLSHFTTEPAAKALAKDHPDVAARAFRALGLRVVNAGKSRYYGAALQNFTDARDCYLRAGQEAGWNALVATIRSAHARKSGFLAAFERIAAGRTEPPERSFLDRARSKWHGPPT